MFIFSYCRIAGRRNWTNCWPKSVTSLPEILVHFAFHNNFDLFPSLFVWTVSNRPDRKPTCSPVYFNISDNSTIKVKCPVFNITISVSINIYIGRHSSSSTTFISFPQHFWIFQTMCILDSRDFNRPGNCCVKKFLSKYYICNTNSIIL